ncbi:14399_t:CDS:2, partial [Cetraspora pellucida]
IRNLLTEIKELRKSIININTKVEKTYAKAKFNDKWPDKCFDKDRDQYEYNILRVISKDLDLGMNYTSIDEAVSYIEIVKKKIKDQMIMLKVAKKEEITITQSEIITQTISINQVDITTQSMPITQNYTTKSKKQEQMMENSHVITVKRLGTS